MENVNVKEVDTSFLKNELVVVEYIMKPTKEIRDPKHVAYGGKLEGTYDHISPPRLRKDKMQNILTKEEKEGLEYLMGRDLSIYGDFWRAYKKGGMFPIALGKRRVILNKSVPEDYIIWKVLLNTGIVANSVDILKDQPKASYKYVLTNEKQTEEMEAQSIDDKAAGFAFYSKYSTDEAMLKYILSALGKHTSKNQTAQFLRGEVGKALEVPSNLKIVLTLADDKKLPIKVMIQEAVSLNVIDKISGQYFTKESEAIAGDGEEPTLDNAAKYLGSPVGQEMRLSIEARIKNARD